MSSFVLPTSADLSMVEQMLLPDLMESDPIFDILPIEKVDSDVIAFEQLDDYIGLQALRGLNGQPGNVTRVGAKRYEVKPGIYGEYTTLEESEITKRRKLGTKGAPVNLRDLITEQQRFLLQRRLQRIRWIGWTLLTKGIFSVSNANGSITHTDTFPVQTFNTVRPWSFVALATPFADMKAAQLLARGYSVQFDSEDRLVMNRRTLNTIFSNINPQDAFRFRFHGLGNIQNLARLNWALSSMGLPQVVVYDKTWSDTDPTNATAAPPSTDSNGNQIYVHNFIPDNTAVMVGRRTDRKPIGAYKITRHASNPHGRPGFHIAVVDSLKTGSPIPRKVTVFDSHNGSPALFYPSAFVIINC